MILTNKLAKSNKATNKTKVTPINQNVDTHTNTSMSSKITTRIIGLITLGMSTSMFVQGLPFLFIFLGGMMGIPTDAKFTSIDTVIWLLTSVAMMIVAVYVFITWMKYVWRRFVVEATPLFRSK